MWPELEHLRAVFLDRVPEFERFDHTDNEYERVERLYKDKMIADVRAIAASDDDDEAAGRRIFRAMIPNEGPLLRWQTDDNFARKFPALAPTFYTAIGWLARDTGSTVDAIMAAADTFAQLRAQGATTLTMGEIVSVAFSVAGMARPDQAVPFKISKAQALGKLLTGDAIFAGSVLQRDQVERWLDLLRRIETVMRDEWHWHPRDLIDVQGFAWVALDKKWKVEDEGNAIDTPIWLVTSRNGDADGVAYFRERGEWHLLYDRGGRMNALVREMQPGDRIVLRDFVPRVTDPPFGTPRQPLTGLRIRATGTVTEQRDDRLSVGVAWDAPTEPRLWYGYTHNNPVWRLRLDREMAQRLAAFIFDGVPQDFAWFAARWSEQDQASVSESRMPDPINLILYGPPGTGKTYATAEHAVRLCGEDVPEDRTELMSAYKRLSDAGRIEFVTFHQSMAYEEFVEGLRPSSVDEDGQPLAAGFRLAPTPGIFRRIARRAETSTGLGAEAFSIGNRDVFKMSLGEAANPDDAYLFEDAISDEQIVLGFDDVDWSDAKFADRDEIMAAAQPFSPETQLSAQSAAVQMPHLFRNWMKEGDWVIVSKGTKLFRAIGIITGDYRFRPREGGGYAHQRSVRWLWVDRAGVPVEEIYSRNFSQRTITGLFTSELNIPALERYANSQQETGSGAPEPFVLVIDEINRANISKVFGELITLLEADKRIGAPDELRVRLPYSGDSFGVPANLHIVGTMNTADRSIALIDKALRRRFTFREMMPDYSVAGMDAEVAGAGVTLAQVLEAINERIEYLLDREHQIGHGWLLGCDSKAKLDAAMRDKIIPLIAEYFFEDWGRTADVLGGREDNPFLHPTTLKPPPGMKDEEPRVRWSVRGTFTPDAYTRLIAG